MAGLGLLLGAVGGAGRAVAQGAEYDQKVADERSLMQERARLEEEKQLRIDEAMRQRQRQAGVQQGQDITTEAQRLMNQRDADAINASQGSQMTAEDAAVLRNNPEARKAYGLLDASRQIDLETRAAGAEEQGYLDAARETRGQQQTDLQNKRQEEQGKSNERRLDLQDERQKQMDEYNKRREDRLDRLAESQVAFQKARAGKEDQRYKDQTERELRLSTNQALQGVNAQLKSLEKESADPLLDPKQKEVLQGQISELRQEGTRYRQALAGHGFEGSMQPAKPFNPADFALGGGKSAGSSAGSSGGGTAPNPFQGGSQAAPAPAERGSRKSAEQIAEEDAKIAAMNRLAGTSTARREAAASQRAGDISQNFDTYLSMLRRGASRTELNRAMDWISSNEDSLSNAQLKAVRDARRSAGL